MSECSQQCSFWKPLGPNTAGLTRGQYCRCWTHGTVCFQEHSEQRCLNDALFPHRKSQVQAVIFFFFYCLCLFQQLLEIAWWGEIPIALGVVQTGNTEAVCARELCHPTSDHCMGHYQTQRLLSAVQFLVCLGAKMVIDMLIKSCSQKAVEQHVQDKKGGQRP